MLRRVIRRLSCYVANYHQACRRCYYRLISSNYSIIGKPNLVQPVLFLGGNKVVFGSDVTLGYFPSPFFYSGYSHFETRGDVSTIEIGNKSHINNNATLIADGARIVIGSQVLAGTHLTIYTSDFHVLDPRLRHSSSDYPRMDVIIGDNVFLGSNITILKGVSIGQNSVIANGSVVSSDIPENVIAGGIPCKVIRKL